MLNVLGPENIETYNHARDAKIHLSYAKLNVRNIKMSKYVSYAASLVVCAGMGYLSTRPGMESLSIIGLGGGATFLGLGIYGSIQHPERLDLLAEAERANEKVTSSKEFKDLEVRVKNFGSAWPPGDKDEWNPLV